MFIQFRPIGRKHFVKALPLEYSVPRQHGFFLQTVRFCFEFFHNLIKLRMTKLMLNVYLKFNLQIDCHFGDDAIDILISNFY